MKKVHIMRAVALCLITTLVFNPFITYSALLQRGSQSREVIKVQQALKQLGYFKYPTATGYYGSMTVSAVKKFQRESGLTADGIVGNKTKRALFVNDEKVSTLTKSSNQSYNGALDWFKDVQYIWSKGSNATVTDVESGKSFDLKRTYGYNHADVEPLTKADANIIKDIWNGWSWERRAVVVNIDGELIAGSMTAMPHAGLDSYPEGIYVSNRSSGYGRGVNLDTVKNNGVNGHMDIHFLNSRTHGTNRVLKSQQDMVKKASRYIEKMAQ